MSWYYKRVWPLHTATVINKQSHTTDHHDWYYIIFCFAFAAATAVITIDSCWKKLIDNCDISFINLCELSSLENSKEKFIRKKFGRKIPNFHHGITMITLNITLVIYMKKGDIHKWQERTTLYKYQTHQSRPNSLTKVT